MPEGPEVETVRRGLVELLIKQRLGKATVSSYRLRWPVHARQLNRLAGATVQSLSAHGKLMWLQLDGAQGLFVRLGMSGSMHVVPRQQPKQSHTHVCIDLPDTAQQLRYVDSRRFGGVWPFFSRAELQQELCRLGPDPLHWSKQQQQRVLQRMQHSNRSLKTLLLDQAVLAGVGNIYACEALFAAKLSPFACACSCSQKQLQRLLQCVQQVLHEAVLHQGTSFQLYRTLRGQQGQFAERLCVFQRQGQPCVVCSQPIARVLQAGRSTFLCACCQTVG